MQFKNSHELQMKKILLISLFCLFPGIYATPQKVKIHSLLKEIETTYAPDKRVCVYNVTMDEHAKEPVLKGEISEPEIYNILLTKIKEITPDIQDSIRLLPDKSFGENQWGIIPLSAIYIRKSPDFGAELTTQALMGTPVKILQKKGGWLQVQTPDMYIGWTSTDNIERINLTQLNEYNQLPKIIVTSHHAFVLEKPNKNSDIITEALMGNLLVVNEMKKGSKYASVTLPDGKKGYIETEKVQSLPVWKKNLKLTGDDLIKLGKTFMGLPYFWGGTTSRGMDCSGFTKTVFYMHGIILPRDASQQYYCGTEVDTSAGWGNLRKGDLLFFGKKNASNPEKPSIVHVAIYIGDMKFIHSSGEIRINSFDPASSDYDSYNHERFIGAKRIDGIVLNGYWNLFAHPWYTSTKTSK